MSGFNHAAVNHEVSALVARRNQSRNGFKKDWKKEKLDRKCDFCKVVGHI